MRIWYVKPYSLAKNIAREYNKYCKAASDKDWICLMDGDTMFLNSDYGHIIAKYIKKYPECQFFIPTVNRVKNTRQCYEGHISEDPNILNHRQIALNVAKTYGIEEMPEGKTITMPCYIFSKKLWKKVGGFTERKRIAGVDWRFSKKAGVYSPCYKMSGLYLFHYYRMDKDIKDLSHLE